MNKRFLIVTMLAVLSVKAFALTLTTDVTSFTLSFLTTDYNAATGAATITKTSGNTLGVNSFLLGWHVTAKAVTSTFGFTPSAGDANPNKPSSDLSIRQPGYTTTYTALTTTPFTLVTGNATFLSTLYYPVDYKLNSNLATDPPGTYTISILFTLTAP